MSETPRLLLLIPTTGYRTGDFLDAAQRLGVQVAVGSDQDAVLSAFTDGRTTQVDFVDHDRAVDQIVRYAARYPLVSAAFDVTSRLARSVLVDPVPLNSVWDNSISRRGSLRRPP